MLGMQRRARLVGAEILGAALLLAVGSAACIPAEWGAPAIIRPWRRPLSGVHPRLPYEDLDVQSGDVRLRGWLVRAPGARRGCLVYLHGIADNRESGLGIAERFVPRGHDVVLYDSRAHGASTGEYCTYGVHEKEDLRRVLGAVGADKVLLIGVSLGGAVALQAAAVEPRIRGVVALSPFSDLEAIVRERAPWFVSEGDVRRSLALAGRLAGFDPAQASPARAAAHVTVPVLLIHGALDHDTPPGHSVRIASALAGPKTLRLIPGAGHNDILGHAATWQAIDAWLSALDPP